VSILQFIKHIFLPETFCDAKYAKNAFAAGGSFAPDLADGADDAPKDPRLGRRHTLLGKPTVSYSHSIVTMTLSCLISETKRYISRKSQLFHIPCWLAFVAPVRGSQSEYCHNVWYGKTRMVWLPDGEKKFEAGPIYPFRQTGRIPAYDRHTSCHSIVCAMHSIVRYVTTILQMQKNESN